MRVSIRVSINFLVISVNIDSLKFLSGPQLLWSQVTAMAIKKFFYSIRNYILLIIQFVIPALFVVITMLIERFSNVGGDLPGLSIAFNEYPMTVTTVERGSMTSGSVVEGVFTSFESLVNDQSGEHSLRVTTRDFQEQILDQYRSSIFETNSNFMIGVTFSDSGIRAWFNNQAFHTAPLAVNSINNAILRFANVKLVLNYC